MKPATFTITADHLTLLRASEWRESDCEFGAPEMDGKRPYGNSSVESDLAEAEQERALEAETDRLVTVHRELPMVLNVATSAMSWTPGTYTRVGRGPWSLVPAEPKPEPDPSDPRQIAVSLMLDAARQLDDIRDALPTALEDLGIVLPEADYEALIDKLTDLAETADITIEWTEVAS